MTSCCLSVRLRRGIPLLPSRHAAEAVANLLRNFALRYTSFAVVISPLICMLAKTIWRRGVERAARWADVVCAVAVLARRDGVSWKRGAVTPSWLHTPCSANTYQRVWEGAVPGAEWTEAAGSSALGVRGNAGVRWRVDSVHVRQFGRLAAVTVSCHATASKRSLHARTCITLYVRCTWDPDSLKTSVVWSKWHGKFCRGR